MKENLIFGSIQKVLTRKKVKSVPSGTSGIRYDFPRTKFFRSQRLNIKLKTTTDNIFNRREQELLVICSLCQFLRLHLQ